MNGTKERWTVPAVILVVAILSTLAIAGPDDPLPSGAEMPATFTFEEAWKAADHLKRTNRYAEAVALYAKIVANCDTDDEIRKHVPRAMIQTGECQYRQKLYREAYETYDLLVTKYAKIAPTEAADAAYFRYRSAVALFGAERNRENEARKLEAREALLVGFPKHPRAVDLGYHIGVDWIAIGDAMTAAGKAVEARKSFGKALSYLEMVTAKSVLFQKAKVRRGEVFCKLGRTDEALVIFRRILSDEPPKTSDPQRLANRRTARVLAVYYTALCHREKEAWPEVLAALADFETKYGTDRDGKLFVPSVKLQRIRALLALDRAEDATKEAESIRADHAKHPGFALAARLLGRHFFEAGQWKAAAKWLEVVLAEVRPPTAEDLALAGLASEKTGNLERAEKRLAAAVTRRETDLAAEVGVIRDQGRVDVDLATYRQALARIRKALGR